MTTKVKGEMRYVYPNVSKLLSDNTLAAGNTVKTNGYTSSSDNGGSTYLIQTKQYAEDNGYVLPDGYTVPILQSVHLDLGNGLWALNVADEYNSAMAGIVETKYGEPDPVENYSEEIFALMVVAAGEGKEVTIGVKGPDHYIPIVNTISLPFNLTYRMNSFVRLMDRSGTGGIWCAISFGAPFPDRGWTGGSSNITGYNTLIDGNFFVTADGVNGENGLCPCAADSVNNRFYGGTIKNIRQGFEGSGFGGRAVNFEYMGSNILVEGFTFEDCSTCVHRNARETAHTYGRPYWANQISNSIATNCSVLVECNTDNAQDVEDYNVGVLQINGFTAFNCGITKNVGGILNKNFLVGGSRFQGIEINDMSIVNWEDQSGTPYPEIDSVVMFNKIQNCNLDIKFHGITTSLITTTRGKVTWSDVSGMDNTTFNMEVTGQITGDVVSVNPAGTAGDVQSPVGRWFNSYIDVKDMSTTSSRFFNFSSLITQVRARYLNSGFGDWYPIGQYTGTVGALDHLDYRGSEMNINDLTISSSESSTPILSDKTINISIDNTLQMQILSDQIRMYNLPTSSAGLPGGTLWNNSGTLMIT